MIIFDCNCWYGVPIKAPLAPALTPADVLAEMDFCGIHRALLRNAACFEESPEVGNPLTCAGAATSERFAPSWALLPPHTGELGDVTDLLAAMRQAGVRSLWAHPAEHRYLLNRTSCGGLLEEMVARRIPLFLPRKATSGGLDAYALADSLLADFPELRLILVGHGPWGEDRYFRPLMARYPHFAVDTSRYELDGGIEGICQTYGPQRLLFGTNFPLTYMGGPLLTLLQATISDEDRALIAGGNLQQLLEEARP